MPAAANDAGLKEKGASLVPCPMEAHGPQKVNPEDHPMADLPLNRRKGW